MKKCNMAAVIAGLLLAVAGWGCCSAKAYATESATVKTGVYAEDIDLSGMTIEEAGQAITDRIEELAEVELTLVAADGQEVKTTAGELGIAWANPGLLEEAISLGTTGNVIQRYKVMKDLEHEKLVYDIALTFDLNAIDDLLEKEGTRFDREAVSASLSRVDGKFQIVEGQEGYQLDVETSIDIVYDFLTQKWQGEEAQIGLHILVKEPGGSAKELAQVQDVLATFTTSYASSGVSRTANVDNGAKLINGTTLYPGEEFSTLEKITPFTTENGYYNAASYLNGKVVDSLGGGICQVSTTLYNSVLLAELEVTERYNHSMIVTYVDPSADAAIAESAGKDFKFINNTDAPIYIECITKNKRLTINIYGKEMRPENRKVEYVSEILETIMPSSDTIYQDAAQPIGYILNGDSMHIGYKARLWKIVSEDGVEVSREQVNKSNYKMTPRSATVGVATQDPVAYNEMQAAIGTGSIDHVKNVIALLTGQAAAAQNSGEVITNEAPAE